MANLNQQEVSSKLQFLSRTEHFERKWFFEGGPYNFHLKPLCVGGVGRGQAGACACVIEN
ncbi:hypothetical protein CRENBAI_010748 [Crenichthys baileyi]|uniref:Uncharacterized protein n=1 Tax=Crenichthys baileyi TaxID=28760 RepID=A0AAV9RMI9_9TELE